MWPKIARIPWKIPFTLLKKPYAIFLWNVHRTSALRTQFCEKSRPARSYLPKKGTVSLSSQTRRNRPLLPFKGSPCRDPCAYSPHTGSIVFRSYIRLRRAFRMYLMRKHENRSRHTIGFWSRTLSPTERNYSAFERESLDVILAVKILRPYLERKQPNYRTST